MTAYEPIPTGLGRQTDSLDVSGSRQAEQLRGDLAARLLPQDQIQLMTSVLSGAVTFVRACTTRRSAAARTWRAAPPCTRHTLPPTIA
jgi:hypothetical protein